MFALGKVLVALETKGGSDPDEVRAPSSVMSTRRASIRGFQFFSFLCISHIIQLTPQQQSAESRNSAGAEALAVAIRPKRHRGRSFFFLVHEGVFL